MTDDPMNTHPCDWDTEDGCPICGCTRETMELLRRIPVITQ